MNPLPSDYGPRTVPEGSASRQDCEGCSSALLGEDISMRSIRGEIRIQNYIEQICFAGERQTVTKQQLLMCTGTGWMDTSNVQRRVLYNTPL